MSYHTRKIEKGVLGEFSKMREEFEEFKDGLEQQDSILCLCELSDLVGATEMYIKRWDMDFRYIIYGINGSEVFNVPKYDFQKQSFVDIFDYSFGLIEYIINHEDHKMADIIVGICEFFYVVQEYLKTMNLSLDDLKKFSDKTVSAFISGKRN